MMKSESLFSHHRKQVTRNHLLLVALAFAWGGTSYALPTGPQIVNGTAAFIQTPNLLTINNSNNAILNWQQFNIAASEAVRFNQPSANSSVLNRVLGSDPSAIYGQLGSNGRVWLINPAGILVGPNARIDTAGFVASTLSLRNEDFLAGRLTFGGNSNASSVVNQGSITTPDGGSVYLIAPTVSNEGLITTPKGETILAAGQTVRLIDTATPGVNVEVTGSEGNATNLGSIVAEAGRIGVAGVLVRNSGTLNASSVVNQGGRIFLKARQDTYVDQNARIDSSGSKGGNIEVLGNRVAVTDQAQLDASGQNGGGSVLVGGDYQGKNPVVQNAYITYFGPQASLKADAVASGDGGKVIVWADDTTRAYGAISAKGSKRDGNGGLVETSGKNYLDVAGAKIDTRAPAGFSGNWLLDPTDITISHSVASVLPLGGSNFNPGGSMSFTSDFDLNTQLATTDVTINTSSVDTAGTGAITVNGTADSGGAVSISNTTGGAHTLTFTTSGAINIHSGASIAGSTGNALNVTLTSTGGTIQLDSGSSITASGGNIAIKSSGANVNLLGSVNAGAGEVSISAGSSGTISVNNANSGGVGSAGKLGLSARSIILTNDTASTPALQATQGITLLTDSLKLTTPSNLAASTGSSGVIHMAPFTSSKPVVVGGTESSSGCMASVASGVNCLWLPINIASSSTMNTHGIAIGNDRGTWPFDKVVSTRPITGNISFVEAFTLLAGGATDLLLATGGSISQGAAAITTSKLGVRASGSVDLSTANNSVSTLAGKSDTGSFSFKNSSALTVGGLSLTYSTDAGSITSTMNGIAATSGTVTLTANGVSVNAPISGASVYIGGGTTGINGTGVISASNLYLQPYSGGSGAIGSSGTPLNTSSPGGSGSANISVGYSSSSGPNAVYLSHTGNASLQSVFTGAQSARVTGSITPGTSVVSGTNDTLNLSLDASATNVTLTAGTYSSSQLAAEIQTRINAVAPPGKTVKVSLDGSGRIVIASSNGSVSSISVTGGTAVTPFLGTPTSTSAFGTPVSLVASSNLSLSANSIYTSVSDLKLSAGSGLTIPASSQLIGANIDLSGNLMDIAAVGSPATINAGTGSVWLHPATAGIPIDLGAKSSVLNNTLKLSADELNTVSAGTLRIGTTAAGSLNISAAIAPATVTGSNAGILAFESGGSVTQAATGAITANKLAIKSLGDVTLDTATNSNSVGTLSASIGDASNINKNFLFKNGASLIIGNVNSLPGIVNNKFDNTTAPTAGGIASLTTTAGTLTQTAGATLSVKGVNAVGYAGVSLTESNPTGVISGSSTAGGFSYHSTNAINVSQIDGVSGITANDATNGNVKLTSDHASGITQTAGALISSTGLALQTAGVVNLPETNYVTNIAANLTGSGNFLLKSNNSNLNIGTVQSITGINTSGSVSIGTTGNISSSLSGTALSTTGAVNLVAGLNGASQTITSTSTVVAGTGDITLTNAKIHSGGAMTLSAGNAIAVSAPTAPAGFDSGGNQSITAASLSLTAGASGNGNQSTIQSNGGTQNITLTGGNTTVLSLVAGGSTSADSNDMAMIINSIPGSSGNQTINLTGINAGVQLKGGAGSGTAFVDNGCNNAGGSSSLCGTSGNMANISMYKTSATSSPGTQSINFSQAGGSISLIGGSNGKNNWASIDSVGALSITGNPNITVQSGASGGANIALSGQTKWFGGKNDAFISSELGALTINAQNVIVNASTAASGSVSQAMINSGTSLALNTTGDLTVTGGVGTPVTVISDNSSAAQDAQATAALLGTWGTGATALNIGGNLTLTGGSGSAGKLAIQRGQGKLDIKVGGNATVNGNVGGVSLWYDTAASAQPVVLAAKGNLNIGPWQTIAPGGDLTLIAGWDGTSTLGVTSGIGNLTIDRANLYTPGQLKLATGQDLIIHGDRQTVNTSGFGYVTGNTVVVSAGNDVNIDSLSSFGSTTPSYWGINTDGTNTNPASLQVNAGGNINLLAGSGTSGNSVSIFSKNLLTISAQRLKMAAGVTGSNNMAVVASSGAQSITLNGSYNAVTPVLSLSAGGSTGDYNDYVTVSHSSADSQTLTGNQSITFAGSNANAVFKGGAGSGMGGNVLSGMCPSNGSGSTLCAGRISVNSAGIENYFGNQVLDFQNGGSLSLYGGSAGNHNVAFVANLSSSTQSIGIGNVSANYPAITLYGGRSGGTWDPAPFWLSNDASIVSYGSQVVKASSITMQGVDPVLHALAPAVGGASIQQLGANGSQNIVANNSISLTGGDNATSFPTVYGAAIYSTGSGGQTITSQSLRLTGGTSGNNNQAIVQATNGPQNINLTGSGTTELSLTGGGNSSGSYNNYASIYQEYASGSQNFTFSGTTTSVTLQGGNGSGTGDVSSSGCATGYYGCSSNYASIVNKGSNGQNFNFSSGSSSIFLTGGNNGNRNHALIYNNSAGTQSITSTATGNRPEITLIGGSSGGYGPTSDSANYASNPPEFAQGFTSKAANYAVIASGNYLASVAGTQNIDAKAITLKGTPLTGTPSGVTGAGLFSASDQTINVTGALELWGGKSTDWSRTRLWSRGGIQTINAYSLSLQGYDDDQTTPLLHEATNIVTVGAWGTQQDITLNHALTLKGGTGGLTLITPASGSAYWSGNSAAANVLTNGTDSAGTGTAQHITMKDGGAVISLTGPRAALGTGNSGSGAQTITFQNGGSISLQGANLAAYYDSALDDFGTTIGSAGSQTISGVTSISVSGGSVPHGRAQIGAAGTQTISANQITITGGSGTGSYDNAATIGHDTAGNQSIAITGTSGSLFLSGGSGSGTGDTASAGCSSTFGCSSSYASLYNGSGTQTIDFLASGGSITLTGGAVGKNNFAAIENDANTRQKIGSSTAANYPSIVLTGGASGGAWNTTGNIGNSAEIYTGDSSGSQTIQASSIILSGSGDSSTVGGAFIGGGASQDITTTGSVTLTGGHSTVATPGNSHNIATAVGIGATSNISMTLNIGGNLTLTGGSSPATSSVALVGSLNGTATGTVAVTGTKTVTSNTASGGSAALINVTALAPAAPSLADCTTTPTLSGCTSVLPALSSCTINPTATGCSAVLPPLSTCTTTPTAAGCSAVLPPLTTCTTSPTTAGCAAVLPPLTTCTTTPAAAGCSAVLPPLSTCTTTPTAAGCSAVLPPLTTCTTTPTAAGCSAVLPPLTTCTTTPTAPGCSAVLPPLATCTTTPTAAGCSAVLPPLSTCTTTPTAAGCSAVLPPLTTCTTTPTAAGCSAVLPPLTTCTTTPTAPGCSAVLPPLATCTTTPTAAGCSAVLPPLSTCTTTPTAAGCSAVLPPLTTCTTTPTAAGCSAVLPPLTTCTTTPTAPGCSAVLPPLATCTTTPTAAGCSAVLPPLSTCTTTPTAAGCSAVLPPLTTCTTTPTAAGCSAVLPTISTCTTSPTAAGCSAVLPPLSTCTTTPTAAGCSAVLPPIATCATTPTAAGCSAVLPTIDACTTNPTSVGCSAVLPPLATCTTTPSAAGCAAVLPPIATCTTTPTAAGCSAVLPTLNTCTTTPSAAGCSAVLPPITNCTTNPTLAGCSAVLPSVASCSTDPSLAGCVAVIPPAAPVAQAAVAKEVIAVTTTVSKPASEAAAAPPAPPPPAPIVTTTGTTSLAMLKTNQTIGGSEGTFGGTSTPVISAPQATTSIGAPSLSPSASSSSSGFGSSSSSGSASSTGNTASTTSVSRANTGSSTSTTASAASGSSSSSESSTSTGSSSSSSSSTSSGSSGSSSEADKPAESKPAEKPAASDDKKEEKKEEKKDDKKEEKKEDSAKKADDKPATKKPAVCS